MTKGFTPGMNVLNFNYVKLFLNTEDFKYVLLQTHIVL